MIYQIPPQKGIITAKMTYNNNAVSGGILILYKVEIVQENNGDYSFVFTDDFIDSGVRSLDIFDRLDIMF